MIIIGSYYYKFIPLLLAQYTDDNGLELGGLFNGLKRNVKDYSDAIEKIKGLDSLDIFKNGKVDIDAFTKAVGTSDSVLIGYTETLKDTDGVIDLTTASTEGLSAYLKKSGNMFNFAAIKATLLNTALNAGIFLVASLAIQGIAKALDNYIHRVEKARERTDELFDEFKQMNDTLADHKKTVSELADRYDELSKGVNLSTNDNVSLSTEEYEEFLDINEQLAQSFPELAKGIDENGNSILTLGTKGITAKEELEELLQTEEDLNNFRIAQGLEDAFKGVYTYVEDANKATEKLNGTINDSSEAMSKLQDIAENGIKLTGENNQLILAGNTNNQAELDYMDSLTASVNEFWKSLDGNRRVELGVYPSDLFVQNFDDTDDTGAFEVYANLYNLTPEELTALENIIQDNVGDASGALLDSISDQSQKELEKIQKSENAWTDFIPALVSGMKSKQTFKNLDSDLQDIAVQIVEGLDYSYADAMKEYDPDPYAYIRDKFIVPMGNLNDSDKQKLQSGFEQLLKLDAGDLSQSNQAEIEKLINTIADLLEKDPLEIRVALGFDVEDIQNRYNEALKEAKRQLGGYGHDERGFETNNAVGNQLDDFWAKNVVTEEDWALWKKVTDGITDAAEAMDTYTEAKKNANAVDMDKTPATLSISDTISQLNTQLKPAFDSLKSAYQDIFTDDGFTLENVDLSMLDSIKSKLDEMSESKLEVDYSAFEALVSILNDAESEEGDVRDAFDDLAASITEAAITGAEDFETLKAALEDLGIVNEELVAFEALISNTEALKETGLDLSSATDEQISAFANEIVSAENVSQAIAMLTFQKELCGIQDMDTSGEVANLLSLAENAGYTGEVIQYLTELEQLYQQVASGTLSPGNLDAKLARAKELEGLIKGSASKINYEPKVSYKPGKGSGGGSSKSKKETEETFDWIERAIENLEDEISKLDKVSSSAYSSISEKNEALAESIGKINEEIDLQQQAYERYMEKAESVGLSDEYKNLVQNGDVDIESVTDDDLKEAIKNYEQWYDKAKEAQDKIDDLYDDAKDKHVEAYESEAGEIEKLREDQVITEREYLDAMLALYEKYYAGQADFANQAKEAKLKYLKEEKDYLNTVAEAASSLIDDQIDETEDEKDKARKVYEDEIAGIEESIKAKEKEKDAIQLKIDALKDEGDELDRQKNLLDAIKSKEEALYALERAKSQRSQLLYKDGQMIWNVDDSKIREANQNVDDAQAAVDKAERDIRIADLQIEIDTIQKGIDALEEEKAGLEALADESDALFDKKIADMKEYQNEWKKVLEFEERSIAIENLKSMFGEDAVEQILAHNTTLLEVWKQTCIDTMAAIDLAANGSVGAVTQQWGELAGVSVDMEKAMELSELSIEDLKDKAKSLGIAMDDVAQSSKDAETAINDTDTSSVNEQLQSTGQSAQNAQEQIKGVTDKLDALSSDVQSCEIPPIDSQQFTASLGGEDGSGGILGQLNTFIERFREICSEIPSIWSGVMQSMGGQGSVPDETAGYDALFSPLLNAMDSTKAAIDTKLQEYAGAWTQFNTDLGGIIGISSGGSAEKGEGGRGKHGIHPPSGKASGSGDSKESSGTDTIVGTITAGGEASVEALNESWIPGFEGFASSIDGICSSVCSMVADMANEVIDMVNAALKALKELEAKNTGAYKIDKVSNSYVSHPVSAANASGTLSSAGGRGAVTKDQKSLVNELGNEMLIRDGMLHEITGGAQEVQLKKGDIILNHKQTEELKKYHRVTSGGGHGKLVGSFASGTAGSSKISILDNNIRDMWGSEEFKKLLAYVEKLRDGQSILIDQNNTILKDKDGSPYREGTIITPKGDVYTPLPDDHPTIQLQKKFESYVQKMGGIDFLGANAMVQHEKQMEQMVKQITNSTVVTNNNMQPTITFGDINITCPGVTDQHVMKHVGIALEHEFTGLAMKAYQKSMTSR